MRFIPTRIHGILDYVVGALLVVSPWLFDFDFGGAETWLPIILGAGAIAYSLITDYELGLVPKLSMRTHLTLDLVSGILLALSPWIFGFADRVVAPHLLIGLFEIAAALTTVTSPSSGPQRPYNVRPTGA